jgi:hypothetical protein
MVCRRNAYDDGISERYEVASGASVLPVVKAVRRVSTDVVKDSAVTRSQKGLRPRHTGSTRTALLDRLGFTPGWGVRWSTPPTRTASPGSPPRSCSAMSPSLTLGRTEGQGNLGRGVRGDCNTCIRTVALWVAVLLSILGRTRRHSPTGGTRPRKARLDEAIARLQALTDSLPAAASSRGAGRGPGFGAATSGGERVDSGGGPVACSAQPDQSGPGRSGHNRKHPLAVGPYVCRRVVQLAPAERGPPGNQ